MLSAFTKIALGMRTLRQFQIIGRQEWMLVLFVASCMVTGTAAQQHSPLPPLPGSLEIVKPFVEEHCVDCHNERDKTGGLSLEKIRSEEVSKRAELWEKVIHKLRHRQMPPDEMPQPDESARNLFVSTLESSIDRSAATSPNPGRTESLRRLTRNEYHNAIRDLIALDVEVSSLLPKDEISHGFDNITVSGLSPMLLERYLAAAKNISRLAIGRPIREAESKIFTIPLDLTQEDHIDGLPLGTRGGAVVHHHFPLDGEYEFQLRLTRNRDGRVEGLSESHQVELILDGMPVRSFVVERPPKNRSHDHVDRHLSATLPVKAGSHRVSATFIKKTATLLESDRQPYLAHFNNARHARTQPALYSINIFGPLNVSGSGKTATRDRIFSVYPSDASEEDRCAETIISTLMRRAYRRPIAAAELLSPLRFYKKEKDREGFEAGIEMALRAILVSPHFLFKIEQQPSGASANETYSLPSVELASRLSFFLWSSIPDDELLDTAIQGDLLDPVELENQVRRMLDDHKSQALVRNFAGQWLYLRNLDSVKPDLRSFLDFDDNLRQSMRRETELFFASIMREDRSVLDFLLADYTYLDERLGKHYGIPNVYGSRFRRVALTHNDARGGLLTHGSILTVTSNATRTSPVVRGMWILTNILGTPPKPPPPDVPQLKEKKASDISTPFPSMRERIAEHRKNSVCASCHDAMDPLGLALENYDAIGRWRALDEGNSIDASGTLSDGSAFNGAIELQQAIGKRPKIFVTTLSEKLLTYALGRGLEYYDAPAIRKIVNDASRSDYRFSSLILGIVNSTPFQMRRSQ